MPPTLVQSLGFKNTRMARAALYRRAKLLFDFTEERSPVSTAQGALLLSYHSPMRREKRVNSFWLMTAIQFAREANAHRYHTSRNSTAQQRNTLKRLWWCCILRDRVLPLGMRRHVQISSADFDWSLTPLNDEDLESEVFCSKVYDASTKRSLIQLMVVFCELAVSLTGVLELVYPLNGFPNPIISTEQADQIFHRIETCKSSLKSWFEKTTINFPTPTARGMMHDSLVLYTNLTYMYYQ